ncbi:MAG: hypothetical protein QOE70_3543 [Chthoniobacter sp.]|jgi:hypothetical protein|nr:hypothetical protein [Chthoniobacter sp.]
MSLKGFHIFFITLSILLAAGCAVWAFVNDVARPFGIVSSLVAMALVVYGVSFIRKTRRLIL